MVHCILRPDIDSSTLGTAVVQDTSRQGVKLKFHGTDTDTDTYTDIRDVPIV